MSSSNNLVLLILLVLTISLTLLAEASQERRELPSEEEKKDMERQLKAINKPALKSFKTKQGEIYDCIDIYKQLAFDHPLLKNHFVNALAYMQLKPTTVPEWITSNNTSRKVDPLKLLQEGINCPDGTVIVKRTTMQDLMHAQRLKSMGFDGPRHYLREINNTDVTGQYYVATVDYGPSNFTGVKGNLNLWDPQVSQDQVSLAFMAVAGGSKGRFSSIFVGWMDRVKGDWWFSYENENVGYWPASLFKADGFDNRAIYSSWRGQVFSPATEKTPIMGSGHWPMEGLGKAAYVNSIKIIDGSGKDLDPSLKAGETSSKCYKSIYVHEDKDPWMRAVYYGGPGGCIGK